MSVEIVKQYEEFARYCSDLAFEAGTREVCQRLLDMAREYADAADAMHRLVKSGEA
jgi:hypothetical protein